MLSVYSLCICIYVLPVRIACVSVLVHYCCLVLLLIIPTHYCCQEQIVIGGYPKPSLYIMGIKVSVHDCCWISFFFLTLLLGNWFWYNTVTRPTLSTGPTQHYVIGKFFGLAKLSKVLMHNPEQLNTYRYIMPARSYDFPWSPRCSTAAECSSFQSVASWAWIHCQDLKSLTPQITNAATSTSLYRLCNQVFSLLYLVSLVTRAAWRLLLLPQKR